MRKKSYLGLVLWMVAFLGLMLGTVFLPTEDEALLTRLVFNLCTIGVAALCLIMLLTDHAYWINGVTYEECASAGPERRRLYVWRHFVRFAIAAGIYLIYSVVAQILGLTFWIDLAIVFFGMVGVAISTIGIQL